MITERDNAGSGGQGGRLDGVLCGRKTPLPRVIWPSRSSRKQATSAWLAFTAAHNQSSQPTFTNVLKGKSPVGISVQECKTDDLLLTHQPPLCTGKKCVYGNCFKRRKRKRGENDGPTSRTVIPAYDHYNSLFSICDNFNRALHDRTWPHKHGVGNGVAGDLGHKHNFALSSIILQQAEYLRCLQLRPRHRYFRF